MTLTLKAFLGALVVVLITLLAKSKNYYLAGLIPLFPTFSLIAHYTVARDQSPQALKTTALFGAFALVPYLSYMLIIYFVAEKWSLFWTLTTASLTWCLFALLLVSVWIRLVPGGH